MLNKNQTNWDELLEDCVFVYRTSVSRVLNDTPFFMLYARDPTLPQDLKYPLNKNDTNNSEDILQEHKIHQLQTLSKQHELLRLRKESYQAEYKAYYDQKHCQVNFQVNDLVMVYYPAPKVGMTYKFLL